MAQWPRNEKRSYVGGDFAKQVTDLEEQWAQAAKTNDSAKVAALLSDVFVEMDADGSLRDKSEALDRIKGDKWQVNEISDIKVTVNGYLAIATGAWQGKGTSADGKTVDAHERWLDTWVKDVKWQCVASASAPAKV